MATFVAIAAVWAFLGMGMLLCIPGVYTLYRWAGGKKPLRRWVKENL